MFFSGFCHVSFMLFLVFFRHILISILLAVFLFLFAFFRNILIIIFLVLFLILVVFSRHIVSIFFSMFFHVFLFLYFLFVFFRHILISKFYCVPFCNSLRIFLPFWDIFQIDFFFALFLIFFPNNPLCQYLFIFDSFSLFCSKYLLLFSRNLFLFLLWYHCCSVILSVLLLDFSIINNYFLNNLVCSHFSIRSIIFT